MSDADLTNYLTEAVSAQRIVRSAARGLHSASVTDSGKLAKREGAFSPGPPYGRGLAAAKS